MAIFCFEFLGVDDGFIAFQNGAVGGFTVEHDGGAVCSASGEVGGGDARKLDNAGVCGFEEQVVARDAFAPDVAGVVAFDFEVAREFEFVAEVDYSGHVGLDLVDAWRHNDDFDT